MNKYFIKIAIRASFAILIAHFPFNGNCQEVVPTFYKHYEVINLLEEVKTAIEAVHPNPYHSVSKEYITSRFSSAAKTLPDQISEIELYKLLLPLVNSFNDGHIQVTCPFGKFINKGINENKGIFPFTLYQLDGGIYVKISVFDSIVKPGYRLVSIDDVSIDTIVNKLSEYKFGDNTSIRKQKTIDDFTALDFFVNQGKEIYKIGYQMRDCDSTYFCAVNSAKMKDIIRFNKSFKVSRKEYFLKSRIKLNQLIYMQLHPNRNVALLTLPSFDVDQDIELIYSQKIDSVFQILATSKVDTLLIDIRDNQGGRDYPSECILSHIASVDYNFGQAFMKSSKFQKELYSKVLKSKLSDSLYLNSMEYSNFFSRKDGEIFALERSTSKKSDTDKLYKGKIFILTSTKTFSAAVSFAAVCKCYGFATIVGEETDGRTTCYTSSVPVPLSIPIIQLGVAHRKVVNACSEDSNSGLIPNVYIKKTHNSILTGNDEVLEYFVNPL
jgi:hypothetical protein